MTYARQDQYTLGSFMFPAVDVAADVSTAVEGHTAVGVGSQVFVYGGQLEDGSMLSSLSTFTYQGSG